MSKELVFVDKQQSKNTISTLEVAEMIGVKHWELIRKLEGGKDRKGYIEIFTDNQMVVSDYFIESSYTDASGKANKSYNCTKLGCEFLANKFTGEKGILFTAKYVKRFNEMQAELQKPMSALEIIAANAAALVEQEKRVAEVEFKRQEQEKQIQGIRDVVAINVTNWRQESNNVINKIAKLQDGNFQNVRADSHELLEHRAKCKLSIRLTNLKRQMLENGCSKSKVDRTNTNA